MELISIHFALLAIVSVFIYYLINHKYRITYLVFISCLFIAGYNYFLIIYLLAYSLINYIIGIRIYVSKFKRILFKTGVILNLTQLVVLKYASFAIDPILQIFDFNFNISRLTDILIPFGVSYFTLQGIGYLINIKTGWEKPEKKFQNFLLYIIFYPKFLSGPIERSNHFLPQLQTVRPFNEQQVIAGLRIALFGCFKKVIIANPLGILVNTVYSDLNSFGGINLWITILIQPLYLYFDFSGYTDIAVGLAKTYGIELLPNFDRPFLSENVTTFWKRFHMSLSLWFNDYLFKPISYRYRRWGLFASVFSVLLTFTFFGFWHGAGWNFMLLGLAQALAINYEFFTKKSRISIFSRIPHFWRRWLGRILTYIFYAMSLIFFFSSNINASISYISKLRNLELTKNYDISIKFIFLSLICSSIFLIIEILNNDYKAYFIKIERYWSNHMFVRLMVYYILIIFILSHLSGELTFIYQMF